MYSFCLLGNLWNILMLVSHLHLLLGFFMYIRRNLLNFLLFYESFLVLNLVICLLLTPLRFLNRRCRLQRSWSLSAICNRLFRRRLIQLHVWTRLPLTISLLITGFKVLLHFLRCRRRLLRRNLLWLYRRDCLILLNWLLLIFWRTIVVGMTRLLQRRFAELFSCLTLAIVLWNASRTDCVSLGPSWADSLLLRNSFGSIDRL